MSDFINILNEYDAVKLNADGTVEESSQFPPEQSSYGSADEYIEKMGSPEGLNGWVPVRGISNQQKADKDSYVMHGSEFLDDLIIDFLLEKYGAGQYAIAVIDDEENEATAWVLMYHR